MSRAPGAAREQSLGNAPRLAPADPKKCGVFPAGCTATLPKSPDTPVVIGTPLLTINKLK